MEKSLAFEFIKKCAHFARNVLWVAESAAALADAYNTELSRPEVYVLEQMAMNGTVVGDAPSSGWQRLIRTLRGERGFELAERFLVSNVEEILENGRAGIAVWIGNRVVHTDDQTFCVNLCKRMRRRSSWDKP